MNEPVYRPPSVWITQALLLPFLVATAIALPITLLQCFSSEQMQSCSSPHRILAFLSSFLCFAVVLLTFWGLQKRKRYGKWLAVSLLIGGLVAGLAESRMLQLIYHSIAQWQPLPAPPYACWEKEHSFSRISHFCGYKSYQELVRRIISDILSASLLGFLAVRLLYSRDAKQFFRK